MNRPAPSRAALRRARLRTPLADVLAYLSRKRANAQQMAGRLPEFQEEARWTVRQIDIFTDDLRSGLHLGEARLRTGRRKDKEA
ncbi:hypothetical protein [uncultured Novosphingobium sp.]|uniref:hypothetical protein n=1 Tax=uncultured Novosphingobium sp. TaxID=292277 RepID=UPI002587190C|nr:hypothetical protein [uncultured Novosphingobium sp.]